MSVLGRTWTDPIEAILKTGFQNFENKKIGMRGLAKENGARIDILAVVSTRKSRSGVFRKFIEACQAEYETVCVWVVFNPVVADALKRYGFTEVLMSGIDSVPGWRWGRADLIEERP